MVVDWNEIFRSAHKHPELRLAYMSQVRFVRHERLALMRKLFRAAMLEPVHTLYLTNDLLWAISKLSMELEPQYLLEQAINARMPFPHMVIEWNGQARSDVYRSMRVEQELDSTMETVHPEHDHPAFMLRDFGDHKFIKNISWDAKEKRLALFPLSVALGNTDQKPFWNDLVRKLGKPQLVAEYLFTSKIVEKHPEIVNIVDDPRIRLYPHGPIADVATDMLDKGSYETNKKALRTFMAGTAGQFRWFGALCALLNSPKVIRYVDALPGAEITTSGKRKPSEGRQMLTLLLPRERVVTRILHKAERERKKAGRHEVMGHWCYSRKKGNRDCNHAWPLQPTSRQICNHCGAVRWFREAFERGEGEVLKKKLRRAHFSGVSLERVLEDLKTHDH